MTVNHIYLLSTNIPIAKVTKSRGAAGMEGGESQKWTAGKSGI
jgi:hypothetical protein